MSSKQQYFITQLDEFSCSIEQVHDHMKENGLTELEVYKAELYNDNDFMFCRWALAVGEKGECGSHCEGYEPRNGKSGMCKHQSNRMATFGDKIKIKL